MPSTVVSERWTARSADLSVEDFFAFRGAAPFMLLYGDGPGERWTILGQDPLVELAEPGTQGFRFERTGEVPPLLPDFMGFVGYEFGHRLEPLLPAPAARPFPFPDFHFALHRTLRLYDRATGTLYEGVRETPRQAEPRLHGLETGGFAARKRADSD